MAWGAPRESPGQSSQVPTRREAREREGPGAHSSVDPSSQKVPGERGLCPAQGLWGPRVLSKQVGNE